MRYWEQYQIPNPRDEEAIQTAQDLIEQADEELFCAIGFKEHKFHASLNICCYLLHQSLEKWIKAALQMGTGSFQRGHDLQKLLQPLCSLTNGEPNLEVVLRILNEDPILIGRRYPDAVRYRQGTEEYALEQHARILFKAVYRAKRIIVSWLQLQTEE